MRKVRTSLVLENSFHFLFLITKFPFCFFVFSVFCENNFLLLLLFFVYRSLKIENKVKTRCYFCN